MLLNILKEDKNVQVECKEDDGTLWGISFVNSSDNSTELTLIKEHTTDKELIEITEKVNAIEE